MDYYSNPNSSEGNGESSISHYYEQNIVDDKGEVSVNLDLLPEASRPSSNTNNNQQTIIDTTGGK